MTTFFHIMLFQFFKNYLLWRAMNFWCFFEKLPTFQDRTRLVTVILGWPIAILGLGSYRLGNSLFPYSCIVIVCLVSVENSVIFPQVDSKEEEEREPSKYENCLKIHFASFRFTEKFSLKYEPYLPFLNAQSSVFCVDFFVSQNMRGLITSSGYCSTN